MHEPFFVTAKNLREGMELIKQDGVDSAISVVQFSFPPQRGVVVSNGLLKVKEPQAYNMRSQDLEPIYHDAGQFYCIDVEKFIQSKKLLGDKCMPIIVSDLEVQAIDNEDDWKIAEMKYSLMQKN